MRRMISNRESARRSRRRKLEHVQCLDGQIQAMARENHALLSRLQASEQRAHDAGVDNTRLKEELESLKAQVRTRVNTSSTRSLSCELKTDKHRGCVAAVQQRHQQTAHPRHLPGASRSALRLMARFREVGLFNASIVPFDLTCTAELSLRKAKTGHVRKALLALGR